MGTKVPTERLTMPKTRNADGSLRRFKLTMVSVRVNSRRQTKFFHLPVDEKGQPHIPANFYEDNFDIPRGATYTPGG